MRAAIVLHLDGRDVGDLQLALSVLQSCDELYLRAHRDTPRLFQSGVVYAREPIGDTVASSEERLASVPEVLSLGWGDCDDLAAWLAAERTVLDGIPCHARVVLQGVRDDGSHLWHCVVVHPDGRVEDPSIALGMGGPDELSGYYPEEGEVW